MPYIELKTDKKISKEIESELVRRFGKAIETFPGKTERYLMVNVEGERAMAFAGEIGNCCMVSIDLLGSASEDVYAAMTKLTCKLVSEALDIPTDRIYVKYSEFKIWGWNNINF